MIFSKNVLMMKVMRMIKKCSTCGKEYILNPYYDSLLIPDGISEETKEKLKYVPNCNCYENRNKKIQRVKEKKFKEENLQRKIQKYKDVSVIDSKFLKSTFKNSIFNEIGIKSAYKYAKNFIKKNGSSLGILFYGPPGTGKTYATACISNYLMDHGKTVLVFSLDLYLSKIKASFGDTEEELLNLVKSCDLLVLDDFGGESALSEWAISKIFNLIDIRYRSEKAILISTNLKFNKENKKCEIFKKFKIKNICRIKDRINEMCYPIKLEGSSKRQVLVQEFFDFIGGKDAYGK